MKFSFSFDSSRAAAKAKSLSAATLAWLRGSDGADSPAPQLINPYQQSAWVYACVSAIARQLAQMEFVLARETARGEQRLVGEPLGRLLDRPHPFLNRIEFWELLASWLLIRGRAYVVALDAAGGVLALPNLARGTIPARLLVLSADQIQNRVIGNTLVEFRYSASAGDPFPSTTFGPDELLCWRLPDPFDFWGGLGPLSLARLAATTDFSSAQMMKGLVQNNGALSNVIETEQQLDEPQREQVLAAYKESLRHAGTPNRPLVLWGGLKMAKPEISSADMQFLENRKFNRQEICAAFGVPQEIIGFTEDANRSVSSNARLNFIENTVLPLAERIAAGFAPVVQSAGADVIGYFDADDLPVMREAQRARVETAVKLWGMGVPFNDINESLDLGFKAFPWHAIGYLPFSVAPAGESPAGTLPEPGAPPAEPPPSADSARLLRLFDGMKPAPATAAARQLPAPEVHCCAPDPRWEAALSGAIRLLRGKLQRFFFEQRVKVLAHLGAAGKSFATTRDFEELDALIAEENARLLGVVNPVLRTTLLFGGQQIFHELNYSGIFQLPPARAMEFLKSRENQIKGANENVFASLKASLTEGLAAGETHQQLIERVKETYKAVDSGRAETIAQTETSIAANGGRFEGMKQAGVELKGWQTSNLQNVRASHRQAERDYEHGIPIEESFRVGGAWLRFPGDPAGDAPEETINCRCFTFAVLPGQAKSEAPLLDFKTFAALTGLQR